MSSDTLFHLIALKLIPGIGDFGAKNLISYAGSPENVFQLKKEQLLKIPGVGKSTADVIINHSVFNNAEVEMQFIEKYNIKSVAYFEAEYPKRLRQCEDSPSLLFYKGNHQLEQAKMLAIVGTRLCTPYGQEITNSIIEGLRPTGVAIVSGLAYGIDIAAHKAALRAGLSTIAVLGHSLDKVYPPEHKKTAEQLMETGALLSEFMSSTKFNPENFPKRNRIIVGLSDATLVIEAAISGGALISADCAFGYNRDVFAVPGKATDKFSAGCNKLIKENKAQLVESASDIIKALNWDLPKNTKNVRQAKLMIDLSAEQQLIAGFLGTNGPATLDTIAHECKMPVSKTSGILLEMELSGFARALPGKVFEII